MNNSIELVRLVPVTQALRRQTAGQMLRHTALALSLMMWAGTAALAQVSFGISMPGVSIGINVPVYPQLVPVPNYPVYYAPGLQSNYFFYDGMYWVYQRDNWYASSWYNGPWGLVSPQAVPLYVLRIPVRYYRNPPAYFRGWQYDAPPRWEQHWGHEWSQQRRGWDHWDHRAAPPAAPLPTYQRQYSGNRYPQVQQQQALQNHNYRYQPHEAAVRQQYQHQGAPTWTPEPQRQPSVQNRPPQQQQQLQVQQQGQWPQQLQVQQPGQWQQPSAGRTASPMPGQPQRHWDVQGYDRGNGKAKGHEQERDSRDGQGQQHKN
jgi:hypothetical protein